MSRTTPKQPAPSLDALLAQTCTSEDIADSAEQELFQRNLWHISQALTGFLWSLPLALILSVYALNGQTRAPAFSPWVLGLMELVLLVSASRLFRVRSVPLAWEETSWSTMFWATGTFLLYPFIHWWYDVPESTAMAVNMALHWAFATCLIAQLNHQVGAIGSVLGLKTLRDEAKVFFRAVTFMFVCMWTFLAAMILMAVHILDGDWLSIASMAMLRVRGHLFFISLIPLSLTLFLLWKTRQICVGLLIGDLVGQAEPRNK